MNETRRRRPIRQELNGGVVTPDENPLVGHCVSAEISSGPHYIGRNVGVLHIGVIVVVPELAGEQFRPSEHIPGGRQRHLAREDEGRYARNENYHGGLACVMN